MIILTQNVKIAEHRERSQNLVEQSTGNGSLLNAETRLQQRHGRLSRFNSKGNSRDWLSLNWWPQQATLERGSGSPSSISCDLPRFCKPRCGNIRVGHLFDCCQCVLKGLDP